MKQKQLDEQNSYINELKKEEAEKQSGISRVEEEIALHKKNKRFLDLIAIACGYK